jgi:hypothetical protein
VIAFAAFMLAPGVDYPETGLAFEDAFERSSFTADLYLSARLREQAHLLTLHDHLAYLRIAHFDPYQWSSMFPLFLRQASSAPGELQAEMIQVLDKLALRWYPSNDGLQGGLDMPFLIGSAYLHLGEPAKARTLLVASQEEFGCRPSVSFQIGRADFRLGRQAAGAAACREALREDPNLGGILERLALLPEGAEHAHRLMEAMEWTAGLPS